MESDGETGRDRRSHEGSGAQREWRTSSETLNHVGNVLASRMFEFLGGKLSAKEDRDREDHARDAPAVPEEQESHHHL